MQKNTPYTQSNYIKTYTQNTQNNAGIRDN